MHTSDWYPIVQLSADTIVRWDYRPNPSKYSRQTSSLSVMWLLWLMWGFAEDWEQTQLPFWNTTGPHYSIIKRTLQSYWHI